MRLRGLTGGIASGKTTVSRMLTARGVLVLDADQVYHGLLLPEEGRPSRLALAISEAFAGTLKPDGNLDRKLLGARVFHDPAARHKLEVITHPQVAQAVQNQLAAWRAAGVRQAVYDVPLLYEKGLEEAMDGVVVIWVPRAMQKRRLMARDGLDETAAEARLEAQLPIDEKRRRARWCIDNSGTQAATEAQVDGLLQAWDSD